MIKDALKFAKDVQSELSKVMWPKFDDYVGSTIVVLVLIAFFAIYLFLVDQGLLQCVQFVFKVYGGY
jgi:preprotein translocase subunit SecE